MMKNQTISPGFKNSFTLPSAIGGKGLLYNKSLDKIIEPIKLKLQLPLPRARLIKATSSHAADEI